MTTPRSAAPEDTPEEDLPPLKPPEEPKHDPYAAFRIPSFSRFTMGNFLFLLFMQMQGMAIGWELYERTNSAFSLGVVGFVQAFPIVLLALPAGHIADRFDRRRIMQCLLIGFLFCSLGLAALSHYYPHQGPALPVQMTDAPAVTSEALKVNKAFKPGTAEGDYDLPVYLMYGIMFLTGVARAFHGPSSGSIVPLLVPEKLLANATTWRISTFHIAQVVGPALGGWVISLYLSATLVYLLAAAGALIFFIALFFIELRPSEKSTEAPSLKSMLAGARFVYENKEIFAAMMLDLFAVLLGGATALLPVYAKDILHIGPTELGWLRAAPAVGSFSMLMIMAHMPPMKRAGPAMLWSVVGFGIATVIFGFSTSFWLSFVMLALTGILDGISVLVRHTLVMLRTPNHMRGRVSAVNGVFINLSNEMGEFESGLVAGWFGVVFAVVSGGVGTVIVVAWVAFSWPQLARLRKLEAPTKE